MAVVDTAAAYLPLSEVRFDRSTPLANGQLERDRVYKGTYLRADVAVKQLQQPDDALLLQECALLRSLTHPHVVPFYGLLRDEDSAATRYAVTEWANDGALLPMLRADAQRVLSDERPLLSERQLVEVALDIASALRYLSEHDPPVVHREIAARNVFMYRVNGCLVAKVCVCVCRFSSFLNFLCVYVSLWMKNLNSYSRSSWTVSHSSRTHSLF